MQAVGRWALAWLALWALWLLVQGEWNGIQIWAAASAATLSLALAAVARRQERAGLRVEARWLLRLLVVPWQVLREFALVTIFLVRALRARGVPRTGGLRRLPFPTGGARPQERGRRTLAALAMTYSPNSYVVDVDEEAHELVVHTLSPVPPGEERL